ncbi:MAG: catalase, partial [Acidimicrobiales bacterium]
AFHPGHLPPGIDLTDDPLLHARLFSYLDTQLTRLGGPNFVQLPINRPVAPVNNNQRDGFGQHAVHEGRAPYSPNSVGGGCPFATGDAGYVHVPQPVDGVKERRRAQSFDDHYSQATLFWTSLTDVEKEHEVGAFSFELSKVGDPVIAGRMLANLANVHADLCERVAANLGEAAPAGSPDASGERSAALSLIPTEPGPVTGRVVGVLVADGADLAGVSAVRAALGKAGAALHVIAPRGGEVEGSTGKALMGDATLFNSDSVVYDAVVVAGGAAGVADHEKAALMLQEAFRHHKVIGAWGDAAGVLAPLGIEGAGVVAGGKPKAFAASLIEAMGWHRHWER